MTSEFRTKEPPSMPKWELDARLESKEIKAENERLHKIHEGWWRYYGKCNVDGRHNAP